MYLTNKKYYYIAHSIQISLIDYVFWVVKLRFWNANWRSGCEFLLHSIMCAFEIACSFWLIIITKWTILLINYTRLKWLVYLFCFTKIDFDAAHNRRTHMCLKYIIDWLFPSFFFLHFLSRMSCVLIKFFIVVCKWFKIFNSHCLNGNSFINHVTIRSTVSNEFLFPFLLLLLFIHWYVIHFKIMLNH